MHTRLLEKINNKFQTILAVFVALTFEFANKVQKKEHDFVGAIATGFATIEAKVIDFAETEFRTHPRLLAAKDAVCERLLSFVEAAQDFENNPRAFLMESKAEGDIKGIIVLFFGAFILIKIMAATVPQSYNDLNNSIAPGGAMGNASVPDQNNIKTGMSFISMLPFIFIGLVILRGMGH